MTSPGGSRRSSNGRALAAITAVVLAAVVLAGLFLRSRGQSAAPGAEGPSSTPSAQATGQSPDPAGTDGSTTCDSGRTGPLREDTRFTATDGSGTVVPFSVSLPDDYYTACKQYPVLYALHGKTQTNASFMDEAMSLRKAMSAGALEQSIIVTPDSYSTGRWENRETGPAEDNFIKRLIPHVEEQYRVKPGPSYRLLVGFSMGGHGAIRFGLKYPDMFAAVWSVDGAMAPSENYLPFVEGKTSDDFRIVSVGGRLNGNRVRTLVDALKQKGVEVPYEYQDLDHSFVEFVRADEKVGWKAMRFLQQSLGRNL